MVVSPNPSFEPKTHQWRPGAVAPSREVPSQICAVLGQKKPLSPKIAPKPGRNAQTKENSGNIHVRLDFTVSKSPLVPFNSTICPRNGPKRCQKAPKRRNMHQPPETKHGPYLGLRGSKSDSEGT